MQTTTQGPYTRIDMQGSSYQEGFPLELSQIPNPPREIWAIGNLSLLNSWCIAVVGTRSPSQIGLQSAHAIAQALADEGYTIVSGLAYGIDAAAHQGALRASGRTIAVLIDIDLDSIYPRENRDLAHVILNNNGLLIAEHAPGASAYMGKYGPALMARDRLQSGLSFCTIPVQAGVGSGTLHTIKSAREQGQGRLVRAPMISQADCQVNPECYAGLFQSIGKDEWFNARDGMPALIESLSSYRHDPSGPLKDWYSRS